VCLCFYPFVAPNGAEAFGCVSVSTHTLPLTGQRFLGVSLFLSLRCPERGRGFWVCLCFYPYVAPNGAEAFGWDTYPYITLTGQYVFWVGYLFSIYYILPRQGLRRDRKSGRFI